MTFHNQQKLGHINHTAERKLVMSGISLIGILYYDKYKETSLCMYGKVIPNAHFVMYLML